VFLLALTALRGDTSAPPINIIPKPNIVVAGSGAFRVDAGTRIAVSGETEGLGYLLESMLRPGTGFPLDVTRRGGRNAVNLRLDRGLTKLGPEGYVLDVRPNGVEIRASAQAGLFYGIQSFRQLLPYQTFRQSATPGLVTEVPCVHIEDMPRFTWRGAMLDVSRHFMPKSFLLKFVDLLALHKMNTFHIHFTDDQGWRIQIKKYPLLTEVGAWHKANKLTDDPTTLNSKPDGGYYTQDDLRELVAYAGARFITIVPEIEMPGHSAAAIASYTTLGNTGKPSRVPGVNEGSPNVLNTSERTIQVYQEILTEVMEIFPSKFIHIGGDEVDKGPWHNNPEVQTQMKDLGLKNEDGLQSWFVGQMDKFLTAHGRRLVGWDEILEGGLAQGATVMSWRGINGGIAAAKANHDVVMAPGEFTYLDHYQSTDHTSEPVAIGGYLPLSRIYGYEPIPASLTPEEARHVLGGQCQLWTEYIPNPRHVEYMAFPRICAMAEVDWSQKDQRSYIDFMSRLRPHLERLQALDVNYRPIDGPVMQAVGTWKSGEMKETFGVHSWPLPNKIDGPGDYKVTFSYTEGACRLDIAWAELVQGDAVLARDEHPGRTGGDTVDNVYALRVRQTPVAGKPCVLRASVRTDGGTDSTGEISFTKQ